VFKIEGRDIPIVHRVIKVHEKDKDDTKFLTKGDNNMVWLLVLDKNKPPFSTLGFQVDDRGLYAPGQYWLQRKDVVGRAKGFVPYVGMVRFLMMIKWKKEFLSELEGIWSSVCYDQMNKEWKFMNQLNICWKYANIHTFFWQKKSFISDIIYSDKLIIYFF
jgi:hypothetical protein